MNTELSYEVLPTAIAEKFTAREALTVSEWADRYRIVPPGTSPEPGAWRTDRVPYLREILDAISDPSVECIYIEAASQIGKSEILLCAIGYFAKQDPSPILLVQATEDAVKSFSKERVAPMFEASPALRGLLSDSARDPSNTTLLRMFPGGMLACAWAGSASSLASRPIRVLLSDELDRWPDSTGRDGDPYAQAKQRTSNFFNRKVLAVSTPTVDGFSKIDRLYDDSDRRRYHVPCPRCGALQVLEWSGVVYKNAEGERDLEDVHYRCAHCKGRIEERERPQMIAAGEWVAENPDADARGYQISALYSPWVRWRDLASEWIKATTEKDKRGLQEFVNLRLGEVWTEEAQRITVDALEKNREAYEAELPTGVLLLTAGVDVQDNRLEAEVIGWGVGRESWAIAYEVVAGDTSKDDVWARLDAFLAKTWSREDGRSLPLWCVCIDSGGHRTSEVYAFCRDRLARNIFASKGASGPGKPIVGKPSTSNQLRIPLYLLGVDTAKEAIYSRLSLPERGPGYCHFPIGGGFDDAFFRGLVSEKRVVKVRAGRRVMEWRQVHPRNEPLDCTVYATAAMEIMTPDFGALAEAEAKVRSSGGGGGAPPAPKRRVLSKGVEW